MVTSIATPFIWLLMQQGVTPSELDRAIQQDAAASAASAAPPVSAPGGAPTTQTQTQTPQDTPAPESPPATPLGEGATVPPAALSPLPATVEGAPFEQSARRPGSSLMNPAMSAIFDGTFGYYGRHLADFKAAGLPPAGDDPSADREGFGMQEVELAFQSAIDPYLEGSLFLTIPNLEGLEVEEAFLVTTSLPLNLQVKAGSFRSQMGRNNTQHLHLQNFTRRPLFTSLLFGGDGMRGPGVQASVLLPLPWFATLYLEGFSLGAPDDPTLVTTFGGGGRRDPSNLTTAAVLEQYWDATENASLMLGLNAATGRLFDCAGATPCPAGGVRASRTLLYGGDLTFRWKPANVTRTYASVQWTTELFFRSIGDGGQTEGAGYTEPVVQFARRWTVGGRLDVVGLPSGDALPRRYGYAGSLTFAPSEFSRFRLYAQEITGPGIPSSTVAFLQTEVSLGAHGAHPY